MSAPKPPSFDPRRRKDLRVELVNRARGWLPEWRPRNEAADFATAMFEVAARLGSEVTQRLDKVPEKAFRGFLDWLGLRGQAGRPAHLPVVFSMASGAEPVLAEAGVQLQALEVDPPVTFETEQALMIVPGSLAKVVGADPAADAFYLPPPGFSPLQAPKPAPNEWIVKSDSRAGSTQLQLEPELGLDESPTLLHENSDQQYRIIKAVGGIVTIEPPVQSVVAAPEGLKVGDRLARVSLFAPFEATERDRQEHALYIGSESLLNLPAQAQIRVEGGELLPPEAGWAYWGKLKGKENIDWQKLTRVASVQSLVLDKPAGDVEMLQIEGQNSRWLRATVASDKGRKTVTVPGLGLAINCPTSGTKPPCPRQPGDPPSTVALEGIANTTPLVLDTPFYPLGREPRLFDAFYLGSAETFSKPNALVQICFQLSDGTTPGLLAASIGAAAGADIMLFGVGSDGNLHRLKPEAGTWRRLASVRPPFSENGIAAVAAPSTPLNRDQPARLTAVSNAPSEVPGALVAVTAKRDVWLWSQRATPAGSRWYHGGTLPETVTKASAVILMREGVGMRMVALGDGTVYQAALPQGWEGKASPPSWEPVRLERPGQTLDQRRPMAGRQQWTQISPVFPIGGRLTGADAANGWVALGGGNVVRHKAGKATYLDDIQGLDEKVVPLAILIESDTYLIIAQQSTTGRVVAWTVEGDEAVELAFEPDLEVTGGFDWVGSTKDDLAIIFAAKHEDEGQVLATWYPLTAAGPVPEHIPAIRSEPIDLLQGTPAVAAGAVIASGPHAEILVVPHDPSQRRAVTVSAAALKDTWLIRGAAAPFEVGDFAVVEGDGGELAHRVEMLAEPSDSDHLYLEGPPEGKGETVKIFRPEPGAAQYSGKVIRATELNLDHTDNDVKEEEFIAILAAKGYPASVHKVMEIRPGKPRVAVLDKSAGKPRNVEYTPVSPRVARIFSRHPALDVQVDLTEKEIAELKHAELRFKGVQPGQRLLMFHPPTGTPKYAVLTQPWISRPPGAGAIEVGLTKTYGALQTIADAKAINPKLSWEYWDGTAWWTIEGLNDGTGDLLYTGAVTFCVPSSLKPTDVGGRTNHWIRARLVGGDYGRESVSVKTAPDPKDSEATIQTVDRSLDDIVAPLIASVDLDYSLCCAVLPDRVLTRDGGAIRDQSQASRTEGASIELFVPLAESIRRAGVSVPAVEPSATDGEPQRPAPAECVECGTARPWPPPAASPANAAAPDADPAAALRALYLGFDAPIEGEPISLLFLVTEGSHDGAYPLQVEVLRANGWEPVVSQDGTRGLNESGVVTVALEGPPVLTALFGSPAHWLRLRPNSRFTAPWQPALRAIHPNAAQARAAETQVLQPLGSSDGSPRQRVRLARPPVLRDSLKLRIREPLGEEDIAELNRTDPDRVLLKLGERDGPWVVWSEVPDPADAAKEDRVYALEDDTGEITFGDGLHGKIPPPGQDGIVAERYLRGGGDEANRVAAWSQINLITPLQGVERVAAPDGAAGGSDPQSADVAVRFGPANLFMRDRALSLRDLELLALQFSPEIAQVRALARGGDVELVVVMRGRERVPPASVRRELVRYLLDRAPPMLAGKLTAVPPTRAMTRFALRLAIDAIEQSGGVAREADRRLTALLDPATGGLERTGWRLGEAPSDVAVAAALDGVGHVEGIESIAIQLVTAKGALEGMPEALGPKQLACLVDDGVSVEFSVSPVGVAG